MREHIGMGTGWVTLLAAAGLWLGGNGVPAGAVTWRIEAEQAGDGSVKKVFAGTTYKEPTWQVKKAADAGAGAFLGCSSDSPGYTVNGESYPIPVRIPHAGQYRVWVRHYQTPGKPTSLYVLFRDDIEEAAVYQQLDYQPRLQTALTRAPAPEAPKDAKLAFGWTSFDATFERPMNATVSFGPALGVTGGKVGIDCVVISDRSTGLTAGDSAFDPEKADWAKLSAEPGPLQALRPPDGMMPAPPLVMNSSFFAGEPDPKNQIKLGMVNAVPAFYRDYPSLLQLGINRDHGTDNGSTKYGIRVMANPAYSYMAQEFIKQTMAPTGRFVNAEGKVGGGFSYSYAPWRKAYLDDLAGKVAAFKDLDEIENFSVCGESGGVFDYSNASRDRFHQWLEQRYATIGKLNELWRAQYASFDQIPLPKPPQESDNKAAWFAFREFCGLEMVSFFAEKAQVIARNDPKHRPCSSQASCMHILAPGYTSVGTIDFEDLINIAFAGQAEFGWDAYSAGDYFVGCDADYLLSLVGNRRLVNNEFNVHGQDPRVMARTYWSQIGKGLKGITMWTYHPALNDWVYVMWALLNTDLTPRDKLAAIADANHEVHRLERLIGPAKPVLPVKPVAFYYSRMDLALPQPLFGIHSGSFDSPYRIYGILRGLGYPVRWITPRQIEAGALKDMGAVVMLGVKYVPGETAQALAQWVKDGGCLIGDQWPGALDEYDRPQTTLLDVFGIRPEETAKPADKAKARMEFETAATPVGGGIDPEVLRALNADELFKRVEEAWAQWDSIHPVAKTAGNWHLSGFDLKKVKRVAGEIIGMGMGNGAAGVPALVINNPGKGHTLYSAIMLGTLFESGPMSYEWDSAQEGPGLYRILDAYLRFSGVEPFARPKLPERVAWKTRIEVPLADARGNLVIGLTSLNDAPLAPFPLALRWPGSAPKPKLALACTGGSRKMAKAPFEIKDGRLTLTMPGFDTHATLLALADSDPLIALEITGAPRAIAGLLEVTPGARLKIKATVWNPSPRKLAAGVVRLYAAPGWFCDATEAKVDAIDSYGSREVSFEVAAPAICAKRALRPIVLKYESAQASSTPATEIVWWTPESGPAPARNGRKTGENP